MAEPDFSVTTPDWLKTGRDVGDEWLRMQAGNQNQQRLNMQQQEQNALLPLKQREAEQTLQLNRLRLDDELKKRGDMVQAEMAAQQLSRGPLADLIKAGKPDEALDMWMEAGVRNPDLFKAKSYVESGNSLRQSITIKSLAAQRRALAEKYGAQADNIDAGDTGGQFAPDNLTKLMAGRDKAISEDRTLDAEDYQFRIDAEQMRQQQSATRIAQANERNKREGTKLDLTLKEAGYTASPGPNGTMTLTPVARPLTTATTGKIQESLRALENSNAAVERALQTVESTPEAFGPLGPVREALEIAGTFLDPERPAPIAGARSTADTAAEDIIRGLKQDSQMSMFEKKQYDRLARITGMTDTPARARAKMVVAQVGIAGKAIRDAHLNHVSEPAWAKRILETKADLTGYSESELIAAINEGYISQGRGLEEFRRRKSQK